jgi:hypothetical protein
MGARLSPTSRDSIARNRTHRRFGS